MPCCLLFGRAGEAALTPLQPRVDDNDNGAKSSFSDSLLVVLGLLVVLVGVLVRRSRVPEGSRSGEGMIGAFTFDCDTRREGAGGGDEGALETSRCDIPFDFLALSAGGGSSRGESISGGAGVEDENGHCGKTTEMGDGGGARSGTVPISVRIDCVLTDRWEKKKDRLCCKDDPELNCRYDEDRGEGMGTAETRVREDECKGH